jgi:putative peptidoglycan lipid II flippase
MGPSHAGGRPNDHERAGRPEGERSGEWPGAGASGRRPRRPQPAGFEAAPGQRPVTPNQSVPGAPIWPPPSAAGAAGAHESANGRGNGSANGRPPREASRSGYIRAARADRPPWEDDDPAYGASWEWESALQGAIPGVGQDDLTGTGKFNAVVPLAPGESAWGRGISAPQPRDAGGARWVARDTTRLDMEADDQPSVRVRALRAGNLARATLIVSAAIMVSRVLGLFRTSLFAYTFGNGHDADAFTYAFTLPDTIFNIVAGGALASAFIPVFTDYLNRKDRDTAWHIASSALNVSTGVLTVLAVICILFATPIVRLFMPGLWVPVAHHVIIGPEVVTLTQVMLLQPIFLGAATIAVAILQARQSFLLPAIGQVLYTVGLIGGILATELDNRFHIFGGGLGIMGPTWGVVAGAVLQFVLQVPGLVRAKMQYRPTLDVTHPGVRHMFRLMGPRIFNAAASYTAIIITTSWLSLIDTSSGNITYGYRTAFTLMQLPLGLFGMAVSQALFPTLAALVADRQWERLRSTFSMTLRGMIYLAIPSAFGMAVLAGPVSRLLLAHGNWKGGVGIVSTPLIYFSFGLIGLAADEILVRCFYALHDSRTPVYVNLANLGFVLGLSYILLQPMGASGLALAFALGAVGEAPVLLLLLAPRLGGVDLRALGVFLLNVLAASLVTALSALFVFTLLGLLVHQTTSAALNTFFLAVQLAIGIGAGIVVYFVFSRFLGIDDAFPLERFTRRFLPQRRA